MLLFGSRAICYTIPEFRKPLDWDVVGTPEDLERLSKALPRHTGKRPTANKTVFLYEGRPLELVIRQPGDYWSLVCEAFKDEPKIEVPILGELTIPPASYCLITKQISLIYRIHHWHKNLEDIYFLRNYIHEIPPHVEALFKATQQNSRDYFASAHTRFPPVPVACHPALPVQPEAELHKVLHERLRFGTRPVAQEPDAWKAFPHLHGQERMDRMQHLLAEEAMVFAAHCRLKERGFPDARSDSALKRFALRELSMSYLPEDWRYFLVNHYWEIASLIPEDWGKYVAEIVGPSPEPLVRPRAGS
jgi:hypothetical protein